MFGRWLKQEIAEANRKSSEAATRIHNQADWDRYQAERLTDLRRSLGRSLPQHSDKPRLLVTSRIPGEGFQIHNLVYESRPGLVVTANLYVPDPLRDSMPCL